MSFVWYAIPSKSENAQTCVNAWRAMGYQVAVWRDAGDSPIDCDLLMRGVYAGYAPSVNKLCQEILAIDPGVEWIVTGGDDVFPDLAHLPADVAAECTGHFGGTYGIMQPTGDRWGTKPGENFVGAAYIDRVAGSPWMGREWCQRAHRGRGPLHPGFFHMFVDEALQNAAQAQGVFWQRPDLTHEHKHWARSAKRQMPEYLRAVNRPAHWREAEALFNRLKAAGFQECLPA